MQVLRLVGEATQSRRLTHTHAQAAGGEASQPSQAKATAGSKRPAGGVTAGPAGKANASAPQPKRGRQRQRVEEEEEEEELAFMSPPRAKRSPRRPARGRANKALTLPFLAEGCGEGSDSPAPAAAAPQPPPLPGGKSRRSLPFAATAEAPAAAAAAAADAAAALAGSQAPASQSSAALLTLVLFDEADNLPEQDRGFAAALSSLIPDTKRPILLTLDGAQLPQALAAAGVQQLSLQAPSHEQLLRLLALVCEAEGCRVALQELSTIVDAQVGGSGVLSVGWPRDREGAGQQAGLSAALKMTHPTAATAICRVGI